jgi:hypothetical protein
MSRFRLNTFIEHDHARRLHALAAMKGVSKSSLVAAALALFLANDGGDRREVALTRRLDQLTRQFGKLERDQNILIETVSLFIRYYLSVTVAVPEAHQDAARAQGKARFAQFVDQLARHLQRGNSLVRDVHEEVFPDASRFFGRNSDRGSSA